MSRPNGMVSNSPNGRADYASHEDTNHPPQSPTKRFYGSNGPSPTTDEGAGAASPGSEPFGSKSFAQRNDQPPGSPDRLRGAGRRNSGSKRICAKCGGDLTGQFVRALDNTWHLECFTCHECGKIVASKFFPVPEQPPHQYPLCETDYFRRLDLLCFACGGALRGSYITALDRKYHIEHFTCSVCPTVFGAQDSYYEHDGSVYCHYHYSTRYAQKCNGCQTAILKQFVEIFRNGQNQHWHPECYMIHKYWNVRLHAPGDTVNERRSIDGEANEQERRLVREEEEKTEAKVLWIWRVLSAYEEKSATCISDMLLHVSNGAYFDGVMSAKRFIVHVDLLFTAADNLDNVMTLQTAKGLSYAREAKLLCKKVVAFFQLLAESQNTGVRRLGVTQELLSLVTGLAHYLKLLIRICLQGALKFEREANGEKGLREFIDAINSLDEKVAADQASETTDLSSLVPTSADTCPICDKPVEDRCFRQDQNVFHITCLKCESCQRDLSSDAGSATWNERGEGLLCTGCIRTSQGGSDAFIAVSRLQQYVHLLRVAHARLLATLRTSGALPHTSDDPNLDKYDSQDGHRLLAPPDTNGPPLLGSGTRSKSYAGKSSFEEKTSAGYEQTLGDIRRLRSTRESKEISNTRKHPRTSRIIGTPERDAVQPGVKGGEESRKHTFHIITDRDLQGEPISQLTFGDNNSLRLDDIPRLVAAEQAKEQRPNANKYARGRLLQQEPKPRIISTHRRTDSGLQDPERLGPEGHRPKRYFSELSALEYFIVRHVAVLSMEPLLDGIFNQEELLNLIETRKPTFWGKFGKAFKQDKTKGGKKKGVFGVSLEILAEKDGAESTDGVGPGALRIPALIQDAISAMRTMDMSMEGVFRKNGNIRRLKEMADTVNEKGGDALDLNLESPVQVAALLKKFLRELPDPVLTYKLHKLFIATQKLQDEETRRRVLHLSCCLLPKSHRDTMEVLFCFLNWVASFSVVDEESGSKMDIHNLATVIAPNILFSSAKIEEMEDSFLAIEAVHCLIDCNEAMCQVPEDLQSILNDSLLFSGSADITTKEILKRYADIGHPVPITNSTPPRGNATDHNGTVIQNSKHQHSTTSSGESRGNSPIVTRIDADNQAARGAQASAAWQWDAPFRPSQDRASGTPPPFAPTNGYVAHSGLYGGPSTAPSSRDSLGLGINGGAGGGGGGGGFGGSGNPGTSSPGGRYYSNRQATDSREQVQSELPARRSDGSVGVT